MSVSDFRQLLGILSALIHFNAALNLPINSSDNNIVKDVIKIRKRLRELVANIWDQMLCCFSMADLEEFPVERRL